MNKKVSSESVVKDIRSRTRKKYSSEDKIRIVLDGLREEDSISSLCRREAISSGVWKTGILHRKPDVTSHLKVN